MKIISNAYRAFGVLGLCFFFFSTAYFQDAPPLPTTTPLPTLSKQFIGRDGLSLTKLIESAATRRADLLGARQRIAIAEGRLVQSGLRPNPVLETEYGSPRFLGGETEYEFTAGISQTLELGGKRSRRMTVARLELERTKAEINAIEREISAKIRANYARAIAAGRQIDVIEKLLAADAELIRVTEARLNEGDVAPLDLNLVKVENDRLRVQLIDALAEIETALGELRTMAGVDPFEPFTIAPQPDRPPLLDITLADLTANAIRDRSDLQAAIIGERLGSAKMSLARAERVPDVDASVRYARNKGVIDLPPTAGGGVALDRENSLTFGIAVDLPIFNRNQGEIAAATAEQIQSAREREYLESTIKRDVSVAYRRYRAAAEKLVLYSTQILPRAEANLQTVRAAYALGDFSIFDVVAEQRRLYENISDYNQVLADYYLTLAELESAVGAALAPEAFVPGSTSIIPSTDSVPRQFNKDDFLKSIKLENPLGTGAQKLTESNIQSIQKEKP